MSEVREWLRDRRARGYLRVSDKRQADKFGPESQKRVELAAAGLHHVIGPALFYEDHISGRDALKRSDFQRMVAAALARDFDVLLVGRVDRFARNEEDAWEYIKKLRLAGLAIYFCQEKVLVPHDEDWQDKIGAEINAAAAYSRHLSRNLRGGLAAKREAGGYTGGLPRTYAYSEDKMRVVPTEATKTRILVWELYATGEYTYRTLADELNSRGHRVRFRGEDILWSKFSVEAVLKRRTDLELGGLDQAVFDRVRELTARRAGAREKVTQRRRRYLFTKVARCECGETYWGKATHGRRPKPAPTTDLSEADAIRIVRKARGLTQAQLATAAGLCRETVNHVEAGRAPARPELVAALERDSRTLADEAEEIRGAAPDHKVQVNLMHAPRGCRGGVRVKSEKKLAAAVGSWLSSWRLTAGDKTRVARFVARPQGGDELRAIRRGQLKRQLEQLRKQHQWEHITDEKYLADRGPLLRALEDLAPQPVVAAPTADVMRQAERIGEAWESADEDLRRRFLEEWFERLVLRSDGTIEVHPRPQYAAIVLAATQWAREGSNLRQLGCEPSALTAELRARPATSRSAVGTVGCAGLEPATFRM